MQIDLFSDVVCPWCYIGSERLDRVLAELGIAATVKHRPFLLDPSTPEGGYDIAEHLRSKFGADPRRIQSRAEASARASGLDLDLTRQPRSYPTLRAHTLLRHAEAKGTQRALVRALFHANFQEAQNISDVAVLQALAGAHGFAPDEVAALLGDPAELAATRAATEEAQRLGIDGVPFFVFDGKVAFAGAQPEEVFREALAQARA